MATVTSPFTKMVKNVMENALLLLGTAIVDLFSNVLGAFFFPLLGLPVDFIFACPLLMELNQDTAARRMTDPIKLSSMTTKIAPNKGHMRAIASGCIRAYLPGWYGSYRELSYTMEIRVKCVFPLSRKSRKFSLTVSKKNRLRMEEIEPVY